MFGNQLGFSDRSGPSIPFLRSGPVSPFIPFPQTFLVFGSLYAAHHSLSIRLAAIDDLPRIVEIYNQSIAGKQSKPRQLQPVSVADGQAWFDAFIQAIVRWWLPKLAANYAQTGKSSSVGAVCHDLYARPAYHISTEIP